jgi:excinuclease ABC subunit B
LYADKITKSMFCAVTETYRRRTIQQEYNEKHWIIPQKAINVIKNLEATKDDNIDIFSKKTDKKKLKRVTKKEKEIILANLQTQLKQAIDNWEFEKAAMLRDQIREIQNSWNINL